jgi:hypothetical protein
MGRFSTSIPLPSLLAGLLALALFAASPAAAHTSPEPALQAQDMLGREIWSRVVKLENYNRHSRYPATVYATIFEFDDVLWFYTSSGTQPLSRSRNRVDQYKQNLLPLFRSIDRGFSSFEFVAGGQDEPTGLAQLENGCVIESIFTLGKLRASGTEVKKANLLLYSTTRNSRRSVGGSPAGHAVLVFETPEGRFFVDPPEIHVVKPLAETAQWDPSILAREIELPYGKMEIREAFFVPASRRALPSGDRAFSSNER